MARMGGWRTITCAAVSRVYDEPRPKRTTRDVPHKLLGCTFRLGAELNIREVGAASALFGILVVGGTIDRAWRKSLEQPLWTVQSWHSALRGVISWLIVGALALILGVAAILV